MLPCLSVARHRPCPAAQLVDQHAVHAAADFGLAASSVRCARGHVGQQVRLHDQELHHSFVVPFRPSAVAGVVVGQVVFVIAEVVGGFAVRADSSSRLVPLVLQAALAGQWQVIGLAWPVSWLISC
jgi:hypothetical protein